MLEARGSGTHAGESSRGLRTVRVPVGATNTP